MKNNLMWAWVLAFLGMLLLVGVGNYLSDKNTIVSKTNRAKCITEAKKANAESLYDLCNDIKDY